MKKALIKAEKEENQAIEDERKRRVEKMAQRREILGNEQERVLKALNAVKESANHSDQVEEYNQSIEILRELKDDLNEKLNQVIVHLENSIDENNYDSQAKKSLEFLKNQTNEISEHLKTVEELGKNVEEFSGTQRVFQLIDVVRQWIEFFLVKVTDAEKREVMRSQYEMMLDNLEFLKENGGDEREIKETERMVAQFKKLLDNVSSRCF
uniref:Uncharacterized protein n=1 Tax=Caenorhabditis tropicalis TaxID=1561998 RepID=A0A1I7UGG4_9PELO